MVGPYRGRISARQQSPCAIHRMLPCPPQTSFSVKLIRLGGALFNFSPSLRSFFVCLVEYFCPGIFKSIFIFIFYFLFNYAFPPRRLFSASVKTHDWLITKCTRICKSLTMPAPNWIFRLKKSYKTSKNRLFIVCSVYMTLRLSVVVLS